MKTKEELHQKVRSTLRLSLVVLKANSHSAAVNRINETKTQDHLGTQPANRRVTGKPGTTPLTTEFLAHLRQSNSRIQITKSRSSKSSRPTSTRNPSFRTSARRRRSTSSILTGKSALSIAVVEEFLNPHRDQKSSKKQLRRLLNPGYVIKKSGRGAKHGPSERQRMYYKAKDMLHKAGQKKHGGHSSILAR